MELIKIEPIFYIYNYSWDENEEALCALEKRAFFEESSSSTMLKSAVKIDPSRSPFIRGRLDVLFEEASLELLMEQVKNLEVVETSFKVEFIQQPKFASPERIPMDERRKIEKEVGLHIRGKVDLKDPEILFGIMEYSGRWLFGQYVKNQAIWLKHHNKPNSYSTALSTRVARAVANIAAPNPDGIKLIDPCCGIGTVLVEALSMGMDIVGSDRNPLVLQGTRANLTHFGLETDVKLQDIHDVTGSYDVAIIDLPYNLCSVISTDEQLELLSSARRIATKVVIVTLEEVDQNIEKAGFTIVDRCDVRKGKFVRQVLVCK
ncbi:RNA methyltransferase [Lottiidibacillus patelloidae]|uniref:RNA methyltransferase n=1 Tax=Lottiidibacillus patelloidae TaxID=2670334 RepID=A0A263BTN6_9BACI|nr:RsmD family RNA methyltransferase [Lottiidibacillus patelloidae]OZM56922.1 RNA methyltransferase [Lottiidibacillus patelloidae]